MINASSQNPSNANSKPAGQSPDEKQDLKPPVPAEENASASRNENKLDMMKTDSASASDASATKPMTLGSDTPASPTGSPMGGDATSNKTSSMATGLAGMKNDAPKTSDAPSTPKPMTTGSVGMHSTSADQPAKPAMPDMAKSEMPSGATTSANDSKTATNATPKNEKLKAKVNTGSQYSLKKDVPTAGGKPDTVPSNGKKADDLQDAIKKIKKKNNGGGFNWKMMAGVAVLLLLVVGGGVGVYITQFNQDLRQQAATFQFQEDGDLEEVTKLDGSSTDTQMFTADGKLNSGDPALDALANQKIPATQMMEEMENLYADSVTAQYGLTIPDYDNVGVMKIKKLPNSYAVWSQFKKVPTDITAGDNRLYLLANDGDLLASGDVESRELVFRAIPIGYMFETIDEDGDTWLNTASVIDLADIKDPNNLVVGVVSVTDDSSVVNMPPFVIYSSPWDEMQQQ